MAASRGESVTLIIIICCVVVTGAFYEITFSQVKKTFLTHSLIAYFIYKLSNGCCLVGMFLVLR